jgi:superfamily II DNA helicase RecQ
VRAEPTDASLSQAAENRLPTETLFQFSRENRERKNLSKEGRKLIMKDIDELDPQSLEVSATILKRLREIFKKDDARFKSSEQAEAIKEALKRESDLLVILPTGGGKSLIYQLPMLIERDMTTVIIVAFVAVVEQVEEQCKELGISCQVWMNKGYSAGKAQAIIVGVEHAVTSDFQDLLIQLESTNRLARIVFDECHTLLTQREFRPVMRRLSGVIRCVSVQLVLLTATLPPSMEDGVRVTLGCESFKVIRNAEARKELKYSVKVVGKEVQSMKDFNREVGQLILQAVRNWKKEDRGLIYCLTTEWTKELAEYLNGKFNRKMCGAYNARMEKSEREEVLKGWKRGEIKFISATGALGAGMDYGPVRLVIHHGYGRSLIEFCQESGRAGRDGKMAESVILFWEGIVGETEWILSEEKEESIGFCKSGLCRKKMLSIVMHGSGEDCLSQKDGEVCDNCEKGLKKSLEWRNLGKVGEKRGREMEGMEVSDVVDLKEMIGELKDRCMMCWTNGKEEVRGHELTRCR